MTERRRIVTAEEPKAGTSDPIHIKYRPKRLSEMIGQKDVVRSLTAALNSKARPHTYLFMGPPGTGKTTLSRIVASAVDAESVIEVDAASNSGVDDVRTLTSSLRYQGFGASPNKAIIIDECHRLSKQAWDGLLKTTEEPPPHAYFMLCTSEPDKVPDSIVRRCLAYTLKLARFDDLMTLLDYVCEEERLETPTAILKQVADACGGSPGLALTMLAKVQACDNEQEAAALLESAMESAELIDLCRLLIRGELDWKKLTSTLKALDMPAESVRIVVANYLGSCLMNPRGGEREVMRFLDMLEPFLKPFNSSDKMAPLLAAFGRILYP